MWQRQLGDMVFEIAGSLLGVAGGQTVVRATSIELSLPLDVRLDRRGGVLVLCGDAPVWRWRTDWDPPLGGLRVRLEEAARETSEP